MLNQCAIKYNAQAFDTQCRLNHAAQFLRLPNLITLQDIFARTEAPSVFNKFIIPSKVFDQEYFVGV